MTESQKLVLKYFHIVCRLSDKDSPITYDKMLQWASESTFYKSMFQTAIQCAISETEAVIKVLENINKPEYATFKINEDLVVDGYEYEDIKQAILTELKQMQ